MKHVQGDIDSGPVGDDDIVIGVGDESISADCCWLATGTAPDARADPALLAAVVHHVDGVPVLDRDRRAGSTRLLVAGRLATIEPRPAAGNVWGARTVARRVSRSVAGVDLDVDAIAEIPSPPALADSTEGAP